MPNTLPYCTSTRSHVRASCDRDKLIVFCRKRGQSDCDEPYNRDPIRSKISKMGAITVEPSYHAQVWEYSPCGCNTPPHPLSIREVRVLEDIRGDPQMSPDVHIEMELFYCMEDSNINIANEYNTDCYILHVSDCGNL